MRSISDDEIEGTSNNLDMIGLGKDTLNNRVVGEDFITHLKGNIFAYDIPSAQYGILLALNALETEKKIILSETLRKRIKDAGIGV